MTTATKAKRAPPGPPAYPKSKPPGKVRDRASVFGHADPRETLAPLDELRRALSLSGTTEPDEVYRSAVAEIERLRERQQPDSPPWIDEADGVPAGRAGMANL